MPTQNWPRALGPGGIVIRQGRPSPGVLESGELPGARGVRTREKLCLSFGGADAQARNWGRAGHATPHFQGKSQANTTIEPAPEQRLGLDWSTHFKSVHDKQICLGHLIAGRGKTWLAVDDNDNDSGTYAWRDEVRKAVVAAGRVS